MKLRSPYPWYGGKRRVADIVWRALGDPPNYVEPFFGSGAVLLGRSQAGKIETINDLDCNVANFWRAIQAAPDEVASWCDWPVNEADLHARHAWLVEQLGTLRTRCAEDPDFYDVKIAGWWVWGLSTWIGSGWCAGPLHRKIPSIGHGSKGIHSLTLPSGKTPRLQRDGGVHTSRLPSLGNAKGIHGLSKPPCAKWFADLAARLRRVRVACGDWKRIVTPAVMGFGSGVGGMKPCAVFLDPPYSHEKRDKDLYAVESGTVAAEVAQWARDNGDNPELRIVLCGLDGEHEMPGTWTRHEWRSKGYGSQKKDSTREVLWFSPHCQAAQLQGSLFGEVANG